MTDNIFGNDLDWVDETDGIAVLPPTLQWKRGDKVNAVPFLKHGCFELPKENWALPLKQPWQEAQVLHEGFDGSGDTMVEAYITDKAHFAIINQVEYWWTNQNVNGKRRKVRVAKYIDGAHSTLLTWALVKELDNEPVIFTASSNNAVHFKAAIETFKSKVIAPASKLAGKSFGLYHFWMPIKTQGVKPAGQAYITPPGLDLPKIDEEVIKSLFVGKDIAEFAMDFRADAQAWVDGNKNYKQSDDSEAVTEQPKEPEFAPPSFEEVPEIPF